MRDEDLNIAKENANKKLFKTIEKFLKTENKRIKKAENRKIGHQNTQKQVKEVKECCCCACCDSCSSSYD